MLAVIMAVTLLPFGGQQSEAASSGIGIILDAPFGNAGIDKETPYETNQSSITLSGITTSMVDPSLVSYKITKVGSQPAQERDEQPAPLLDVDNDKRFTFHDVMLFPGLNKIEIYARHSAGVRTMEERYVYFYNSPNIYELHVIDQQRLPIVNFIAPKHSDIDDQPAFESFKRVFDSVLRITNPFIMIEGKYQNANEITLRGERASTFGDEFVINASNAGLAKGDFDVRFIAKNSSGASADIPYNIAISNGDPILLDVQANLTGDKNVKLDQLETVKLDDKFVGDSDDLTISGFLYLDTESLAPFDSLRITLQRLSDTQTDLATKVIESADLGDYLSVNEPGKYSVYYLDGIKLDDSPLGSFDIYNYPDLYQLVFETFDSINPSERHPNSQTYRFEMVNDTLPYVVDVTQNGVSLKNNNHITRIGQQIVVEVGNSTNQVTLSSDMLSGPYYPASEHTKTPVDNKVTFTLDEVRPGIQTFVITVSNANHTSEERYPIEAILTPTVKLLGVNSGHVFNKRENVEITAEYVNFRNESSRGNTIVTFNGQVLTGLELQKDIFSINIAHTDIIEGANELRVTIYADNGEMYIRTLEFYYLPDDSPFIQISPTPMDSYDEGQFDNEYLTTEEFATLQGTIANGSYILVKNNSDIDNPVLAECQLSGSTWVSAGGNPCLTNVIEFAPNSASATNSWDVTIKNINLILKNIDGTFNFSATNNISIEVFKGAKNTAPSAIQAIRIFRSPAAYDPIALTKSFLDKGVINRNYLPFTIDTDGAIRVTVNKLEMQQIEQPVENSNRIRYHLDVPLKSGNNKLNVEVEYPGVTVKDTIEILSSTINQPGAAQKETLGRTIRFRMFNNDLELTFPRGTLIRQARPESTSNFAELFTDVPLFFGIAMPETGLVLDENKTYMHELRGRFYIPNEYVLAGDLYWVDAGLMENDKTVRGGQAPFSTSGGLRIAQRERQGMFKILEPTQAGTLTLKYDQNIRIGARQLLTVMYHDGELWHNLGGEVDSKKGTITVPFTRFGYYVVMRFDKNYNDVTFHGWARDDIEILRARGWMRELNPDMFGTSALASRGELATMLVKALDIPLDYDGLASFRDVTIGSRDGQRWQYEYIETAARVGIVRGMEYDLFRPSQPITRQDAAVMIARAMNLRLSTPESAMSKLSKKFTDAASINYYARSSVEAIEKKGIMLGRTGADGQVLRFDPGAMLDRAELATITVRMLRDLKRLEK